MPTIHPTAVISPKSHIDSGVQVGPFSIIGENVTLCKDCEVGSSVNIQGHTEIGARCKIFTGAVIGSLTQDLKYRGGDTFIKIGEDNTIREYVTVNSGTAEGESTVIGKKNLLMAYVHIAHNCVIGNNTIIANAGTLAGHVEVEDFAIIGGLAGIHQFCRIGRHAIVGGCSKVTKDVVPFVMADGHPAKPFGVNKTGLKRRGFTPESIGSIEKAYRLLFRSGLNVSEALSEIEKMEETEETACLVSFIRKAERGIAK